jgi:hypothetical protein
MIQLDGELALVTAFGTDPAIHSRITMGEARTSMPICDFTGKGLRVHRDEGGWAQGKDVTP